MEYRFFEFWGQLFSSMAKGQKQMEDADQWFRQAFKGYEPLASIFGEACGLKGREEGSPEYTVMWKQASDHFEKALRDSMALFDVVSREDYLDLTRKCESLEKTVADQEQTIKYLKTLWGQQVNPASSVKDEMQILLTKQQADYQKMLKTLGFPSPAKRKPSVAKKS